ncbi:MAG: COX15/CtaA family protein [Candidatus Solibacter usitatus]|nr:COX15/CtaA family protein [Candidatus Solibacter usitatus]
MWNPWLNRYAYLLAIATLLLVVAGASVTSNEAGLSVPDWPLSYGKLMPEMTGGIFYEHGHRMIATTVGFLSIFLAVWLWRVESRGWLKKLGLAALGAVIFQGLLGGLTVLYLLPKPVSISHACLAQVFFSCTMAIALFTSKGWLHGAPEVEDSGGISLRSLAVGTPVVLLGQLALGAGYRHKAIGLIWHILGAVIATGVVLFFAVSVLSYFQSHRPLRRTAVALLSITFAQVFLGVGAYMSRIATLEAPQPMPLMVWFTVIHVAVGALTMGTAVLLGIQVLRYVRRPRLEVEARQMATT